jgi:hypothetical protein
MTLIRSAPFINPSDLIIRSGPKDPDGLAGQQAKRMMGAANPVTADPESGSTMCQSCNRWHRGGTLCTKSQSPVSTMIAKGRRVAAYESIEPTNPFRDPRDGSFVTAPQSGHAASEAHLSKLRQIVTAHNDSHPEIQPPAPVHEPVQAPVHDQVEAPVQAHADSGFSQPPAQYAAPQPVPAAIRGIHNLLSYKAPPKEHADSAKKLVDNSVHLQGQQAGYLTSLRNWQSMHGGA